MAKPHILFDKTEIMLAVLKGNKFVVVNLTYDKIAKISFEKCSERKFFKKVPSECINIKLSSNHNVYTFYKNKEKKYFDEYKYELEKFAKNNRIVFTDDTKN